MKDSSDRFGPNNMEVKANISTDGKQFPGWNFIRRVFGVTRTFPMSISSTRWAVPLALLLLCLLSYGSFLGRLGYYGEDWVYVWISHALGPEGLREAFSSDKPFLGWLYTLTAPLLGKPPLGWHLLALLTRWLTAVALWWCLRGLWPRRALEVTCVAFLFAVYPGFTQQPFAMMFSHVFIVFVLFLFSLGAMIWAIRAPRWFWPLTIAAVLSSFLSIMILEYFAGLELLRPAFLWLIFAESVTNIRQRLRRTIINWSPYLGVTAIFLIWRLFFFKSTRAATDQEVFFADFMNNPVSELMRRFLFVFTDVIQSSLMAWGQAFRPNLMDFDSRSVWIAWALAFIVATVAVIYLLRLRKIGESKNSAFANSRDSWPKKAIIVGLFAIVVGELPVWFIGRQIKLETLYNRYTLQAMIGACLLTVGLVEIMIRTRLQRIIVISVLVGLAVGFHFRNSNGFHKDWQTQVSLFQQLSWRIPGLKPGTSLMMDERPVSHPLVQGLRTNAASYGEIRNDYPLFPPLNLIYDPQHSSAQTNYWFFNLSRHLGNAIPNLADGVPVQRDERGGINFTGSTSNSLAVWFSPPSCLRVLDPSRDELPQLPSLARSSKAISNIDLIITDGGFQASLPTEIFGPEPERCWCRYFQKADLARQMGDWQKVAQIGYEARQFGLKPEDVTEWLPFIEGFANVGKYDDARQLVKLVLQSTNGEQTMRNFLNGLENRWSQDETLTLFVADLKAQLFLTREPQGNRHSQAELMAQ